MCPWTARPPRAVTWRSTRLPTPFTRNQARYSPGGSSRYGPNVRKPGRSSPRRPIVTRPFDASGSSTTRPVSRASDSASQKMPRGLVSGGADGTVARRFPDAEHVERPVAGRRSARARGRARRAGWRGSARGRRRSPSAGTRPGRGSAGGRRTGAASRASASPTTPEIDDLEWAVDVGEVRAVEPRGVAVQHRDARERRRVEVEPGVSAVAGPERDPQRARPLGPRSSRTPARRRRSPLIPVGRQGW